MNRVTTPLRFAPIYKEKIWGGRNLARRLDKKLPNQSAIGESWEISGFPGDLSRCNTPPFERTDLQELLDRVGEDLVGEGINTNFFPLLYKFIDANDKLSVQVHPGDHQAREHGWGAYGKTECWYIVDAKPGAQIIVGFKEGVSKEDVARAIETTSLETLLNYIDVAPGDVLFIPAGTVHAILDGTLIYEVQESSDTTFRLYDWGRVDQNGASRALHIEESLMVMDTHYHDCHKIPAVECSDFEAGYHGFRVACSYFALEEYRFDRPDSRQLPAKRSFQVISMLGGGCTVGIEKHTARIFRGDTILVPVSDGPVMVTGEKGAHFIVSSIPDLMSEVISVLHDQRIDQYRIAALGGRPANSDIAELME